MEDTKNMLSLRRFVARLPSLKEKTLISGLLSKGSGLSNEDVISMCLDLFLDPKLTLLIGGCFRHLLPQIVRSVVDALKEIYDQRSLAELKGNPDIAGLADELDEYSISRRTWNLCVHEQVVVAFSRILELVPHLLGLIVQYFSFAPPPFERILRGIEVVQQNCTSQPSFLNIVRASYRFILLEPGSFEALWDWSPFLDLLVYEGPDQIDIRWCAAQIVSSVNKLSDEATRAVSLNISHLPEETSFACLLRWEEFCHEITIEKGGWFVEPSTYYEESNVDSGLLEDREDYVKWKCDASGQVTDVDVCSIELSVRRNKFKLGSLPPSLGRWMVPTASLRASLKALALAISQREPILLEGSAGAGKTTLIRELGELTGNTDAVYIHLNEQIDAKTLIGTYVCTEIPGEFQWQPGAITQAVQQGLWLILEDVDKAPSEVLSALVPLVEKREIHVPGRAEIIKAAPNFQLFSTILRTDAASSSHSRGADIMNNSWRKVLITTPSDRELKHMIESLFPELRPLAPKLIETLKLVNNFASQLSIHFRSRCFSTRDLLKWCKRLKNIGEIESLIQHGSVYESIFREAVDCFTGCISDVKARHLAVNGIADIWNIAEEQVVFFDSLNKPLLQVGPDAAQVGRACLPISQTKVKRFSARPYAYTGHSMRNLERVAVCIQHQEPVLLVGETGTGKTTLVQHLAEKVAIPLVVVNLSQQSDSADLIGGFKPMEAQHLCRNLLERFVDLFSRTFPSQRNSEFLGRIHQFTEKGKWNQLLKAFGTAVAKVESLIRTSSLSCAEDDKDADRVDEPKHKRKRPMSNELMCEWEKFSMELARCRQQVLAAEKTFAFSFIEGALVKALKHGHWILLDELNLAPVETLERLTGVLEAENGSLSLTERADIRSISRHPDFRIFACMNPATDVGKHDLPASLKSRFTEFYVDDVIGIDDLQLLVHRYLEGLMPNPPVEAIVDFYQQARSQADVKLYDSANQKPRYSLRSLVRALEYTQVGMPLYGFARALYDGVRMTFVTLLDSSSSAIMEDLIQFHLMKKIGFDFNSKNLIARTPPQPSFDCVEFEHFWLEKGGFHPSDSSYQFTKKYVLTKTIREHLKNLAKAVFIRKYPVLLQGPTSSGKTSLIEYLATITGHRFVRINNHEHTDLQEYLGTYVTGPSGKLVFQEGILVEAVRNGYWLVLDELNLAPSEVLEALNRLLDDNRELFVPELQAVIRPHPHFMLFATQNPPGLYGGRKVLSRAFRNRFLELFVDDIPENELCIILEQRCEVPKSYAEKMVAVMKDLQRNRQTSQAFAGKHGFITARDLFKWADRHRKTGVSYDDLARIGYILLAERLRNESEKSIVHACLERNLRITINLESLHSELSVLSDIQGVKKHLVSDKDANGFKNIVWTKSMVRLFSLVEHCYKHREPILLVGETGCGKTTVCQLLAAIHDRYLHTLNCHQYTETSDFLGGYRPVRDRENIISQFQDTICKINCSKKFRAYHSDELSPSVHCAEDSIQSVGKVVRILKELGQSADVDILEQLLDELRRLQTDSQSLFIWQDGPLVQAMREGSFFLIDEISLADDSVLERLNSVLEPKRLLVLAEKGGSHVEELVAHPDFLIMATMNPGGDVGKKELSPALRNRFTEIWVPRIEEEEDLRSIIDARVSSASLNILTEPLLKFWKWFKEQHVARGLTVRDLLSWISFINSVHEDIGMHNAFIHGAYLVLLDGINLGTGLSSESAVLLMDRCLEFLLKHLPMVSQLNKIDFANEAMSRGKMLQIIEGKIGMHPFFVPRGPVNLKGFTFELMAPTTSTNIFRILRAMQLQKPVLIEGSPGVGKTSLIMALANISGHPLVRINLSEQTDMIDLLGSDLPHEGAEGAEFKWSDGVFLQALKMGSWVLLDELNLASQSVLEGLNACLDHRGEVFIPELGRSFKCHPTFRIFACQNPPLQGGGRKRLPRSFLNRFTKVYVDMLSDEDFLFIARSLYPSIPVAFLQKLIQFNGRLLKDTMIDHSYGHLGAPWEFNLRDVLRSCAILQESNADNMSFLDVIYLQRMRTARDRHCVLKLYKEVFGNTAQLEAYPNILIDPKYLKVGTVSVPRFDGPQSPNEKEGLAFLPSQSKALESLLLCVKHGWMCILVGPTGCGKTSIVRTLSKLMGASLQEFMMSSGTDTADLLGCFEQYDALRCLNQLVSRVRYLIRAVFGGVVIAADTTFPACKLISFLRKLLGDWSTFEKFFNMRFGGSPKSGGIWNNDNRLLNFLDLDLLSRVVDQIRFLNSTFQQNVACLGSEIEAIERELTSLKIKLSNTHNNSHFEWVDGGFLRAVERGDWILLENANLCSPTVLDRLNPLLEPEGSILVNERGLSNDTATVLHAHPNFRLFLTMDPHNGEVSRAMRNRGVEIHLMQPHTWIDNPIVFSGEEKRTKPGKDSQKYLIQAGIPFFSLTTSMKDAHMNFRELLDPSANDYSDGLQKLCQWLRLFWQLFYRGYTLSRSLRCSWDQIYGQESEDVGMREKIANVYSTHLGCLSFASEHLSTLQVPGGWPRPMNISYFCRMSIEAITTRDCMYLKHLLCEWFAHHLYSAWSSADENERKDLLQWLQNQKNLAVMLPTQLYMILLYPSFEDNTVFPDEEKHDTKMLDNMIVYASFWIMRQARSTALRAIQIAWMRFQATKLELHCYSFTLVYKIIQKESEHPLVKELLSDSVHIGANENFYVNVLDALRHMLLQWEMEDDFFNKSSAGLKKSERKSFLLSRKHSKYSGEEAELKDEGFQIYAALLHTRDLEKELLCGQLLQNMKTLKSFLNILDCHKVFWKAFCKTKAGSADIYIKSQGLYLCWKKLKRNIIEAISGIETEELERRLMQIVENIEKKILKKKQIMRLYIWKGCGHPHMPSSDHSFQKLQELLNFCQSFWPYSAHEIVSSTTSADCNTFPISRSGKFRNLVMEGISMGIYAIRSSCKEKNHVSMSIGQELRNAGGVTDEIIKCLQNYVDGQNMQSIFEIGRLRVPGCKCAPLHSIQDSYYYEAILHEAADSSRLVIGPWLDSLALLQDIVVVSIITQMTKMLMCSDNADISVKECHIKDRMLEVIDFALKFSSRSPLDLVPHQHILWLMNAIEENEHLDARWIKEFQMSAHQLRFNWYTAVFGRSQGSNMVQGQASGSSPAALFDASHSVRISHLISDIVPLGQLNIKILELRLAASILWHFKDCEVINSMASDVSHASAALCQLICSFAKSFESENSAQLHLLTTVLHSGVVQECRSNIMNNIEQLKLLLRKSSDGNLVMLLDSHINICLDLLYSEFCCNSPKQDIHFDKSFQSILGRVWLLLGHVRIKLLLPNEAYDPALKYAFKLCALQEALAEAKLELQVYEESDMIIKGGSTTGKYEGLRDRIQGLKDEIEYIASKCVYRPRAENLIFFYSEVNRFVRSLEQFNNIFTTNRLLEMDTEKQSLHQMIQELLQWQDISNGFIKRIQIDFPDFQDLAQPVLLSVYEMKMGCAMLFEAFQQKLLATTTCSTLTASNALEFVCSLMEFPRSYKAIVNALRSLKDEEREPLIPIFEEDFVESMICLLAIKDQNEIMQLKVKIFQCSIMILRNKIAHSGLVHGIYWKTIAMLLRSVSTFWNITRDKLDAKRMEMLTSIKIKHQSHTMGSDLDHDEETFRQYFPSSIGTIGLDTNISDETEGSLSDENVKDDDATPISEHVWRNYECVLAKDLIDLLSLVFHLQSASKDRSTNLVSEEKRFEEFSSSYNTGKIFLEGMCSSLSSCINQRLTSSNMMMLSLREESLCQLQKTLDSFNIYEDSCASEVAPLLTILKSLQKRLAQLLEEWPDQPTLLQLMRGLDVLLSMPIDVPLMKWLIGLEQLLGKAQLWEENTPKNLSLEAVIHPVQRLISRWRKLELDYWEVLLEKVELQYQLEAGRLWFSLYGMLHPKLEAYTESDMEALIVSLEEFIQTAPLGEYRRRVEMLEGFYAEFSSPKLCSDTHPDSLSSTINRILYNLSCYYSQFLPLVEEAISSAKRTVASELGDLVKLQKWDDRNYYTLTSSNETTHRKLFKLISKYKVLLTKPALATVMDNNQKWCSVSERIAAGGPQKSCPEGPSEMHPLKLDDYEYNDGSANECWKIFFVSKSQDLVALTSSCSSHFFSGLVNNWEVKELSSLFSRFGDLLNASILSQDVIQSRQRGTDVLEKLALTVITRSNELRNSEQKQMVKKKALVDLIRALRAVGLSHHRSAIPKKERSSKAWIAHVPCKVDPLLNLFIKFSHGKGDGGGSASFIPDYLSNVSCLWKKACDYFYKNLVLAQKLQHLRLSFHKDLTLQEVGALMAYLEHGIFIQKKQRIFSYEFSLKLLSLQSVSWNLTTIVRDYSTYGHTCLSEGQPLATERPDFERRCLWSVKDLVDFLHNACLETMLLYKKRGDIQTCGGANTLAGITAVLKGLEHIAELLIGCKKSLDELLAPGINLFSPDKLESCWPVIITPNAREIMSRVFSVISMIESFTENIMSKEKDSSSGLSSFRRFCWQASEIVAIYDKQWKNERSPKSSAFSMETYESQREIFISEALLSVQALSKLRSHSKEEYVSDKFVGMVSDRGPLVTEAETVVSWTCFMEEQMSALRLERIYHAAISTVLSGCRSDDKNVQNQVVKDLTIINQTLELVICAGILFLGDYILLHKALSKLSYILGNLFEKLFQEGFCKAHDESGEEDGSNVEDASGTGLGEGQGKTDVSHEIEDEDQLLGCSEKGEGVEERNSGAEKGIEMHENFEGDLMDISADESDENDEEDEGGSQLESMMGEGCDNENTLDERLWGEDEQSTGDGNTEKYEIGPAVQESVSDLEFRAKESDADDIPQQGEHAEERVEKNNKDVEANDSSELIAEDHDQTIDKTNMVDEPSGIDPSCDSAPQQEESEADDVGAEDDVSHDNKEGLENMKIDDELPECQEDGQGVEPSNMTENDESLPDAESLPEESREENTCKQDMVETLNPEYVSNDGLDSALPHGTTLANLPDPSTQNALSKDTDLLPQASSMDSLIEDIPRELFDQSINGSGGQALDSFGESGQEDHNRGSDLGLREDDVQHRQRLEVNPYRCLGDVLKEWKEKVLVREDSVSEVKQKESLNEDSNVEGLEYQYIHEEMETGPQALGPASKEQMDQNKLNEAESLTKMSDEEMETSDQKSLQLKSEERLPSVDEVLMKNVRNNLTLREQDDNIASNHEAEEGSMDLDVKQILEDERGMGANQESYFSINMDQNMSEDHLTDLLSKQKNNIVDYDYQQPYPTVDKGLYNLDKARSLWAALEQHTTQLSQELTEQLRLIMEPSLASRLEGDYRTGKRINLKKVIPYIASQFRRDKIWLRRTKPSKRQYQVVLAIDDSRSMSENHCGYLALAALVTICRSMSTLEVGQMAVASFGQKGNVRVLHDFDSPFSMESGIEIISQFTFRQDNTIADEPMADLLHYITWMLDSCAHKIFGRHQIQQLVLIIADGRFHEKEKLRHCIREALSRGQMVAFIVLDNAPESIMDVQSVSFSGGVPAFSKYIDTFPFPYYILLKNIEELPRTLADLLRQWFEMVQRSSIQ